MPAIFRQNEQVLQINACPSEKGGKIMEKQRKAHFFAFFQSEDHLRLLLFKDPFTQHFLSGDDLSAHLFILRKPADETEDQERIPLICKTPVHHMP